MILPAVARNTIHRKDRKPLFAETEAFLSKNQSRLASEMPSLDVLDQHRNLMMIKRREYQQLLEKKEAELNEDRSTTYFPVPENLKPT